MSTLGTTSTRTIPVRDVRLNGMLLPAAVVSVDITMSEDSHDVAVLRAVGDPLDSYGTAMSKLISFNWGRDGSGRFYGYVTDLTSERQSDKTYLGTTITAQGPTFVLKTGRPRFFTDSTVADVAAQICQEHQLGFSDEYGKKHYSWRTLAQTDESDWGFLTSLCDRIGATLVCSSGVVRLLDPTTVLTRTEPMLYFTSLKDDGRPNMYDMSPVHYSDRLPSQFAPTVSYLANGQAVTMRQDSPVKTLPTVFSADRPIANQAEAALAQIRMPVDWEEQASARFEGEPRIEPGIVVMVKSGASNVDRLPYDGFWYVTSVVHTLTDLVFQSKVDLARVTNAPRLPPVPPSRWLTDIRGRPQLLASPTGSWISSWRGRP